MQGLSRIVAALISTLAVYINEKYPFINITPEIQLWFVGLVTYGLTHLVFDKLKRDVEVNKEIKANKLKGD